MIHYLSTVQQHSTNTICKGGWSSFVTVTGGARASLGLGYSGKSPIYQSNPPLPS